MMQSAISAACLVSGCTLDAWQPHFKLMSARACALYVEQCLWVHLMLDAVFLVPGRNVT